MALIPLSQQDDYNLTNSDQDCRGWLVHDGEGHAIGRVRDMIVDTDAKRVSHIVLEDGTQIPASQISLVNNTVIVRSHTDTTATGATTQTTTNTNAATAVAAASGADISSQTSTRREGEVVLPVIEESINIGKRTVERGGVRLSSHIEERPVEEHVTLHEEQVRVERRPANESLAAGTEAFREGVIEVPLMGEEVVVAKQARVVEEIVVGKETVTHEETIRDTVRRTDVEVERMDDVDAVRRRD